MQDSKRDRDVWNSLLNSVGEGEGGMIWGNVMQTCIISYKKQIASPVSIQDPWGWCSGMTWRDGMGREEVGRGVQDGEHVYACSRFMLMCEPQYNTEPIQYCKVISLQLK